jgi:hypothetical protein
MQLIENRNGKQVYYTALAKPFEFDAPFLGEVYVCILFLRDRTVTQDEQKSLSDQLVRSGCRYAVCTGHQCSSWDDSIDWAYLHTCPDFTPQDESFVMTSWHEDESVAEVIYFGLMNTDFDEHEFSKYLVVVVGGDDACRPELEAAIHSVFDDQSPP